MTRRLLRTTGVLVAVLTLLTAPKTAATPPATTDNSAEEVGPPDGPAGAVPDFVSSILDVIVQFVEGELDGDPGDENSGIASNGGGG